MSNVRLASYFFLWCRPSLDLGLEAFWSQRSGSLTFWTSYSYVTARRCILHKLKGRSIALHVDAAVYHCEICRNAAEDCVVSESWLARRPCKCIVAISSLKRRAINLLVAVSGVWPTKLRRCRSERKGHSMRRAPRPMTFVSMTKNAVDHPRWPNSFILVPVLFV